MSYAAKNRIIWIPQAYLLFLEDHHRYDVLVSVHLGWPANESRSMYLNKTQWCVRVWCETYIMDRRQAIFLRAIMGENTIVTKYGLHICIICSPGHSTALSGDGKFHHHSMQWEYKILKHIYLQDQLLWPENENKMHTANLVGNEDVVYGFCLI